MEENKATDERSHKEQCEYAATVEEKKVSFSSKGIFTICYMVFIAY